MTSLSDLTLAQLATAYGTLAGIETGPKTFNSKSRAISRLEALLAEHGLTLGDALRAAGIEADVATDDSGCESEQTGPYGEDDIPGTEDPPETGMVWDGSGWVRPEATDTEADAAADAPPPAVTDADLEAAVVAIEETLAAESPRPKRSRADSKQAQVIAMLRRPEGTTIAEIAATTGWQHHTVRGFFAGALKKKLALTVTSQKVEGRGRVYCLV